MWVQSLGWEDPLEKEMATPTSILAWRFPWTEEPGGLQSVGLQRVRHNWGDLARMHVLTGRLCFIVLHFITLHRYCFFLFFAKWMFMITQPQQVYGCRLPNSICSLHVSVTHFDNSQCFTLFHYYICYGDLWSVTFDVANIADWRLRSWWFFGNKISFN